MRIGERQVGGGAPVYVIAEIGVNHDGDVGRALELVDAAADAGADAVKTQFFRTDLLMSGAARLAGYQREAGETDPSEMLRRLELTRDEIAAINGRARERGLHAIVTVFSVELVPEAETLGVDAYKSASPDLVNTPLLDAMLATRRPLIVSTGAADGDEVEAVFGATLAPVADRAAMLQCVSSYPTPRNEAALAGMLALGRLTQGRVPIGYSDHTMDEDTGAAAVRIGAAILEKHLTHDRSAAGPDHAASLDPVGFASYVRAAREAEPSEPTTELLASDAIYGEASKRALPRELEVRGVSRQSVVTRRALPANHTLTLGDLTIKRPGFGIPAARLADTIGRALSRPVEADTPLTEADLS